MSNHNSSSDSVQHGSVNSLLRSPAERKRTLQSFLAKTQAINNIDQTTMKNLEEIIRETDAIHLETSIDDKATCQDEVLIDSQIMTASSKVIKSAATMLTKDLNPYNSQDFAENLLRYVHMLPDTTVDKPNWSILEVEMSKILMRTPNFSTLSGCLDPLVKKVAVKRQPVKRDAIAPTSRPQAVVNVEKDDDSVEQTVQKIRKLITDRYKETSKPVEYFRLIINPKDFGKTIENTLHVSFLVRDGFIKILMDDDQNLVIVPCSKEMRAMAKKSEKMTNIQNIMLLNIKQWRTIIEAYRIEQPMINF